MKNKNAFVLLLALFTGCLHFFEETSFADISQDTLKVGVILPLSGEAAGVGGAIKNAIMLAYEKLPEKTQKKIELFFEDDGLVPKNTISAYKKLRSANNIEVVINASSSTAKALAPIVEVNKTPLLALATDPEVVAGKNYVLNFWVTPEEQVRAAVPEAIKRGYKKIARITTIQDFTMAMKGFFDKESKGRIEVVLDEDYPPAIKDFRTYLAKVKAQDDLDAILVVLFPGQLGVFARQAQQMGITLPMFGFETLEDSNEVEASQGALVGQWYVNTDDPNEKFIKEFKAKYPDSSLYGASNAHDLMLLLGAAVEKSLDPEEVNKFFHTFKDFSGALGTYSASGDNRFTLPAAVKVVTKDGFEKLYK